MDAGESNATSSPMRGRLVVAISALLTFLLLGVTLRLKNTDFVSRKSSHHRSLQALPPARIVGNNGGSGFPLGLCEVRRISSISPPCASPNHSLHIITP